MRTARLWILAAVLAALAVIGPSAAEKPPSDAAPLERRVVRDIGYAGARISLVFSPSEFEVGEGVLVDWVLRSARAVTTYFGRFPVRDVRIKLKAVDGNDIVEGAANMDPDARIRITLGSRTNARTLQTDTTLVHELAHLAFPDHDDKHLWLHEGMATYVEWVAYAQSQEIAARRAWSEFMTEMPLGLPESEDQGLDDTPSYNRRYWGGALYFLLADIEIRRRTANRLGVQHALRAIHNAGGTLRDTWSIERTLTTADSATGTTVFQDLYKMMRGQPVSPDLATLWRRLGVQQNGGRVAFDDKAPLAAIRRGITAPPAWPLLLAEPSLVRQGRRQR
ncbi:MAG: hypothetical protein R3D31_08820 [Hyphomicrobiaceae bacterium]